MDRETRFRRLMATFLDELDEHVGALNRHLLDLEKGPGGVPADRLKELFRAAHSLKGAARSVGVGPVEQACHLLEEILSAAREGTTPLASERFPLLFAVADAIEEAGMRLREQQDLSDSPLMALLPHLEAAARDVIPCPDPAPAAALAPPAVPTAEGSPPAADGPPWPTTPAAGRGPAGPPPPHVEAAARGGDPAGTPDLRDPHPRPSTWPILPPVALKPAGGAAFVRVPAEKLDLLLAQSGELLVARRRFEARSEELSTLREFVGRWRAEWSVAARPFRSLAGGEGGPAARGTASPSRHATEAFLQAGDRLGRLDRDLDRLAITLAADDLQLDRAAALLDEEVRRVRMLPFWEACQGLDRAARDVAHARGTQVEVVIEGGDVELDRSVLEGLKDPLLHLVRNAVDHGLEPPDGRARAGKSACGRVTVSAALRGAQVEVVVADDGRGIDPEALRVQARRRGLSIPVDGDDPFGLIFLPGFSTAPTVTNISGRGIGLDVVKSRMEDLHGAIALASEPGLGTRFTLAVPLTLTTLRALLVTAGGQVFAFATTNIVKLVRVGPGDLHPVQGREVLTLGGPPLPVASLAATLGLPEREPAEADARRPGLIVAAGERRMAFLVDGLLAEQEVVVKGLGARIRRVRHASGATILPTGRVALVLNAAHLVRSALGRAPAVTGAGQAAGPGARRAGRRLLVVDDSVTTRTLEKGLLEAAGYEVSTAVDGESAWQLLQEQTVDLLISDVDMPRMDGFALTEAVRRSARLSGLPVILLTSLAGERDRARGIEAGADAYIVKGAFDQKDLIATIEQLL